MTKITISNNKIEIEGHSGWGSAGNDIVCASISTAVYFLIHMSNCKYKIDRGMVTEITTKNTDSKTLNVFIDYAKELSVQYPNNIEVIYEV